LPILWRQRTRNDMKRILFVDDDRRVLDGLRRMLRGMRRQWEMEFVQSGTHALEHLAASPFDMVIADMRMPSMDGAELLHEVMTRHPATVRIILSGHCDRAGVLKSVGPTHQFVTKPCDPDRLKATIAGICWLRDQLPDERMRQVVSRVQSVPSWRPTYEEFVAVLESPAASVNRLGRIVASDVGLSAKMLQLVNSGFFGTPQSVYDPARAVTLLGLDALRALLHSTDAILPFDAGEEYDSPLHLLGTHTLAVSMAAREIAKGENGDAMVVNGAHLAGLLHDVGIPVLAGECPERYIEAMHLASREQISLKEAEKAVFKATRDDVGAYLMGLWGIPEPVVTAIAFHLRPRQCAGHAFSPLTAVHVANALVEQNMSRLPGLVSPVDTDYLARIGCAGRLEVWADICRDAWQAALAAYTPSAVY